MGSTTQGKIRLLQWGAVISVLIIVSIYIWSLKDVSVEASNIASFSNHYGSIYMLKFCYFLLSVLFCVFIWKISKKKNYVGVAFFIECIIYCLAGMRIGYNLCYAIKELCLVLWPAFTYVLAIRLQNLRMRNRPLSYLAGVLLYYMIFTVGIWFIQYNLVMSEFFHRNPVEIIYMLVIGVLSWLVTTQNQADFNYYKKSMIDGILPVMSCVFVFWNHDRILQIIGSLRNPVTSVASDMLTETNWVGYRISLFSDAWLGNLSFLKNDWISEDIYGCPLFWVKYQKGWLPALIMLIMEITLLICIVMLIKNKGAGKKDFIKVLLISVLLHTILGLFADLFLITSTDIGMLMLRNPADILLVLYLVFGEHQIPVLLREERKAETGGSGDENVRHTYAHHSRGR